MPEDTPAKAKLRETADNLKEAAEQAKNQQETGLAIANKELARMYQANANVGTRSVTSEDVAVPSVAIIQKTSTVELAEGEGFKLGSLYRSDTMEQRRGMLVNILCFKKVWADNFNRTAQERKHIYYGAFDGATDIFRMYLRGWSLNGSRKFLSEVKRLQLKWKLPMYALRVRLHTKEEHGTMKDTGKAYSTFSMVLTPVKDAEGNPLVEEDMGRATWMKQMAENLEQMNSSDEEEATPPRGINMKDVGEPAPLKPADAKGETVSPDDIPF